MRIVVLGEEGLLDEIKSRTGSGSHEWIWLKAVEELSGHPNGDLYIDLGFVKEKDRIDRLALLYPRPVLINSVIYTLEEIGGPFIRINAWPGFLKRPIAEITISNKNQEELIKPFFESLNWPYRAVSDIVGMVSPRVVAMIINEAYFTFQEKTSTKAEIDIAMKLGTHYPLGPFEWSREIGLRNIYELLMALSPSDTRYRVAESLEMEVRSAAKQEKISE